MDSVGTLGQLFALAVRLLDSGCVDTVTDLEVVFFDDALPTLSEFREQLAEGANIGCMEVTVFNFDAGVAHGMSSSSTKEHFNDDSRGHFALLADFSRSRDRVTLADPTPRKWMRFWTCSTEALYASLLTVDPASQRQRGFLRIKTGGFGPGLGAAELRRFKQIHGRKFSTVFDPIDANGGSLLPIFLATAGAAACLLHSSRGADLGSLESATPESLAHEVMRWLPSHPEKATGPAEAVAIGRAAANVIANTATHTAAHATAFVPSDREAFARWLLALAQQPAFFSQTATVALRIVSGTTPSWVLLAGHEEIYKFDDGLWLAATSVLTTPALQRLPLHALVNLTSAGVIVSNHPSLGPAGCELLALEGKSQVRGGYQGCFVAHSLALMGLESRPQCDGLQQLSNALNEVLQSSGFSQVTEPVSPDWLRIVKASERRAARQNWVEDEGAVVVASLERLDRPLTIAQLFMVATSTREKFPTLHFGVAHFDEGACKHDLAALRDQLEPNKVNTRRRLIAHVHRQELGLPSLSGRFSDSQFLLLREFSYDKTQDSIEVADEGGNVHRVRLTRVLKAMKRLEPGINPSILVPRRCRGLLSIMANEGKRRSPKMFTGSIREEWVDDTVFEKAVLFHDWVRHHGAIQQPVSVCNLTALGLALEALGVDPRRCRLDDVVVAAGIPLKKISDWGMSLSELCDAALGVICYQKLNFEVECLHFDAGTVTEAEFRAQMQAIKPNAPEVFLCNFHVDTAHGAQGVGGGHVAMLAGFAEESDEVLVLEPNPAKYYHSSKPTFSALPQLPCDMRAHFVYILLTAGTFHSGDVHLAQCSRP